MAEVIRIYHESELGYLKLNTFISVCNGIFELIARQNGDSVKYRIILEKIYFDYNQDWLYTCPVTYNCDTGSSWQSLCPRDYELILKSDSFEQIDNYATSYVDHLLNGAEIDFSKVG